MTFIYLIFGLYIVGPLVLLYLSSDCLSKGIIPSQGKALTILRISRLVWISAVPAGAIVAIFSMLRFDSSDTPSFFIGLLFVTILTATLLLPYYSISNTGNLYRAADYKKMVSVANSPSVGVLFLIGLFVVMSILG